MFGGGGTLWGPTSGPDFGPSLGFGSDLGIPIPRGGPIGSPDESPDGRLWVSPGATGCVPACTNNPDHPALFPTKESKILCACVGVISSDFAWIGIKTTSNRAAKPKRFDQDNMENPLKVCGKQETGSLGKRIPAIGPWNDPISRMTRKFVRAQGQLEHFYMISSKPESIMETHNLDVFHGSREIIQGLNLSIPKGKIVGLLGPNGAGKTTLVRALLGFHTQLRGSLSWKGHPMAQKESDFRSKVGLVPQELALYPELSATENLAFFASLYGMEKNESKTWIRHLLDQVGLSDREKQPAGQFSGGMQRRLNLAIGVINQPEFLILDEPTVGVDPQSRNRMIELLQAWNRDGMTILYTSHFLGEAEILCDELVILDGGKILAQGTLGELLAHLGIRISLSEKVPQRDLIIKEWETHHGGKWQPSITSNALETEVYHKDNYNWFWTRLALHEIPMGEVSIDRPRLEDLFLSLTGKDLRDE